MIRNTARLAGAAILLLAGCGARGESAPPAVPEVADSQPQRPDTLVLEMPGGNNVWLAEGRTARDSAGTLCYERSVEIRREGARLKVPLLFTAGMPTRVDDSTFKTELYQNCRPASAYRVNVRDGMPHKISP